MMKKLLLIAAFTALVALSAAADGWVRINQLGYIPVTTKVAVYMCDDDTPVPEWFTVCDACNNGVVFKARTVPSGELGNMKSTARLDFSALETSGNYVIKVGGAVSPTFSIGNDVYDGTADFLLNYIRQQRCGYNPFQHDSCHTHDAYVRYHPLKEGQRIDVTGGWHDAADLLQYTATSANTIYLLMLAYEHNPEIFADGFLANGEEGSNSIPDIIDEIYWGMQWLDRMNPEKGELYNQIADDRDHIGTKMPKDDPADYGWGPNNGRPVYFVTGEPQQRGKFLNATMGAASTAGKFAADFARGADVLAPFFPGFAAKIGAKAQDAFQVGLDKPGNTQTVSVVSPYIYEEDNWVDDMELAAVELYRSAGDRRFLDMAVDFGRREPVTPWMGADSARHYQWYPFVNMGHCHIARLTEDRLRAEFLRNIKAGIERVGERGKDHPFRWGVPGIWCSNNLTAALLGQCIIYRQMNGDNRFAEIEAALRDWLFGCNPWGTSMVVGLPSNGVTPQAPHSNWVFQNAGMPDGGLVDGPVYTTIFESLRGVNINDDLPHVTPNAYLHFQPGDVVYHDNSHDYSTNEPTLDGTAALIFPLAAYQTEAHKSERQ